jgi:hypothetical protein
MSTNTETPTRIRRPLTAYYIGRPVSLYIHAMAKRRWTQSSLDAHVLPAAPGSSGDGLPQ